MPTARELLEQADALMRRNRALADAEAAAARTAPDDDVPELTESVDAAPAAARSPESRASKAVIRSKRVSTSSIGSSSAACAC
mgnify:CR=1 FL=1